MCADFSGQNSTLPTIKSYNHFQYIAYLGGHKNGCDNGSFSYCGAKIMLRDDNHYRMTYTDEAQVKRAEAV